MLARFLAGFALGAFFLVMLLAAAEANASVPKGGKFERTIPATAACWLFCRPQR